MKYFRRLNTLNSHQVLSGLKLICLLAVMAVGSIRCGGKDEAKKEEAKSYTPGTFSAVFNETFKTSNCAQCHNPNGTAWSNGSHLDFSTQALAYQTLLAENASGISTPGACSGVRITYPSDATKSYIMGVLFTSYNINNFAGQSGCQPYATHLTNLSMSATDKSSMETWIRAGAKND